VQVVAPPSGRALAALPLEMEEPDGEDLPYPGPRRDWRGADASGNGSSLSGGLRRPWWRPASRVGRVFLLFASLVVLVGLAVSAYLLKTYVDSDSRFRISGASNIEAAGLTEVSRAEMLPVFGEDIGRNIFFIPLRERQRQLEEIPWIEKATVMRLLPDQIRVTVVERQPVAFVRQGQQIGLVDANGVLLAMPAVMMAQHHYSFPVVMGIDAGTPLPARKARMATYQRLLAELDASGQQISAQISEVDLTDPQDARVLMQDDAPLLHFGEDHFLERYQRYKAHIAEWRQQYPRLAAVDLRYEQQVVLEMAAGANVAQAAVDAQTAENGSEQKQPVLQAAQSGQAAGKPAKNMPKSRANQAAHLAASGKAAKTGVRMAAKDSARTKTLSVEERAAKTQKAKANRSAEKRAEARRAALKISRRKIAPTGRTVAPAGQGL
jgi:cell division protein FtsQ